MTGERSVSRGCRRCRRWAVPVRRVRTSSSSCSTTNSSTAVSSALTLLVVHAVAGTFHLRPVRSTSTAQRLTQNRSADSMAEGMRRCTLSMNILLRLRLAVSHLRSDCLAPTGVSLLLDCVKRLCGLSEIYDDGQTYLYLPSNGVRKEVRHTACSGPFMCAMIGADTPVPAHRRSTPRTAHRRPSLYDLYVCSWRRRSIDVLSRRRFGEGRSRRHRCNSDSRRRRSHPH